MIPPPRALSPSLSLALPSLSDTLSLSLSISTLFSPIFLFNLYYPSSRPLSISVCVRVFLLSPPFSLSIYIFPILSYFFSMPPPPPLSCSLSLSTVFPLLSFFLLLVPLLPSSVRLVNEALSKYKCHDALRGQTQEHWKNGRIIYRNLSPDLVL